MTSVYNLCVLLINKAKQKGTSTDTIVSKMDVYLAADRLTEEEYNNLLNLIKENNQ